MEKLDLRNYFVDAQDEANDNFFNYDGDDFDDFDEDFDIAIRALVKADIIPQAEYFKLPKEVDANLQGMYFRAKKEKRPFGDVINTYLDAQDITPEEKEKIINLWRSRRKALSLPQF